jgi:hypothetical protein
MGETNSSWLSRLGSKGIEKLAQPAVHKRRNMKTLTDCRKAPKIVLALIIALSAFQIPAQGQVPSGPLQYNFTAQDLPLWNFGGFYAMPHLTQRLHQDAKGGITTFYAESGEGPALVGKITGNASILKMRLRSTVAVEEYIPEEDMFWMRKENLTLTFDPNVRSLVGNNHVSRWREAWVMDCPDSFWECDHWKWVRKTSTAVLPFGVTTPETADGSWKLDLDFVPAGNKLTGTGAITFSNGEALQFQLLGSYSPKKDCTKILLKGIGADQGATMTLSLAGPQMQIEHLRGTVCGQHLRFP